MTDDHVWRKGDLCRRWVGIISRVIEVKKADLSKPPGSRQRYVRLKIVQATPLFGTHSKKTVVLASRCAYVSLVDLGTEYVRFGAFIRDEALRGGMEA
jgi:hypothetical protein